MATTRNQSRESRIRRKIEELRIRYFGYQPLHLPTPIPVSPTNHHMSYEEVMEAGDDYYQMVYFHYLLTFEAERQNGHRLLVEGVITIEDKVAGVRPRESCRMGSEFGGWFNFTSSSLLTADGHFELLLDVWVVKYRSTNGSDSGHLFEKVGISKQDKFQENPTTVEKPKKNRTAEMAASSGSAFALAFLWLLLLTIER
ncbi:hypothetical protein GIB67_001283 [Kingdonia uniflora]|uniref:Uncharacterized protein n=1 Tax=Kingdonia uniflora TaxID=39325 RepID=A0A7J7LL94_9MAGN|nr:hypothetical protein GIB67_001283 [Kingdonia uniflora]